MSSGSFKDGKSYWDSQYKADSSDFDWYQQYGHLEVLFSCIRNDMNVLVTGAGTSRIGVELAERGVASVQHIEQSEHAVNAMKARYGNSGGATWAQMDVCKMTTANGTFDVVVDKACLDAILCEEGGTRKSQLYMKQVARVLKPNGKLILISTGHEAIRRSYLSNSFEEIYVESIHKPSSTPIEDPDAPKHFVYICSQPKA